ncbi:MAG TPA: DegT/DnrJ/EryC1/StrS family aminotransferase, partial [Gemmatimonadaceae bacterium]
MMSLYPRHFLDIATRDLVLAASGSFKSVNPQKETDELEHDIDPHALITLSVRSAWDLLLSALDLPEGSEVVMSAVTIPDMKRIAEAHGLLVVPADLHASTMAPCIESYARAFSDKTRLVVIAHLLGGAFDITPYVRIARSHGVPVVEDRAQAFTGPDAWGSEQVLASFHSFGSIKTSTALGTAVTIVRNRDILDRMREIQSRWAFQDPRHLVRKARKYLAVQGFRSPAFYSAVAGIASITERGLDGFISSTVKGFRAASCDELLRLLRQRPSGSHVALLRRRLETFDRTHLERRKERGELLAHELSLVAEVLGHAQPARTHWLFAVRVNDPRGLIARLRAAGFDATQAATTIGAMSPSES